MTAAELLVRCLENEGVANIFGIPGEENIDVMDALLDSEVRFITTRHEQGAAFMACCDEAVEKILERFPRRALSADGAS